VPYNIILLLLLLLLYMTTTATDTETLFRNAIRVNSILKFNFRPIRHPFVGAAASHGATLYITIIPSHFGPAALSITHTYIHAHKHDINSFVLS
jgi:hypothetical protein